MDIDNEKFYKENFSCRVSEFLNGKNSNVFTYGPSGSGKTYSLGVGYKSGPLEIGDGIFKRNYSSIFFKFNISKHYSNFGGRNI